MSKNYIKLKPFPQHNIRIIGEFFQPLSKLKYVQGKTHHEGEIWIGKAMVWKIILSDI